MFTFSWTRGLVRREGNSWAKRTRAQISTDEIQGEFRPFLKKSIDADNPPTSYIKNDALGESDTVVISGSSWQDIADIINDIHTELTSKIGTFRTNQGLDILPTTPKDLTQNGSVNI